MCFHCIQYCFQLLLFLAQVGFTVVSLNLFVTGFPQGTAFGTILGKIWRNFLCCYQLSTKSVLKPSWSFIIFCQISLKIQMFIELILNPSL